VCQYFDLDRLPLVIGVGYKNRLFEWEVDMYHMMDGSIMSGMGLIGILVLVALILLIIALSKYIFFSKK
jgi:hypothetical protein